MINQDEKRDDTFEEWVYETDSPSELNFQKKTKEFFRNIKERIKQKFFSMSQEDAWMMYYENLFIQKSPSVKEFAHLIKKYGFSYIQNPYVEGHEKYYHFCPDGITLADIDFLLMNWQKKYMSSKKTEPEKENILDKNNTTHYPKLPWECSLEKEKTLQEQINKLSQNWVFLYQHRPFDYPGQSVTYLENLNVKQTQFQEKMWEKKAILCLEILFFSPKINWLWIKEYLHPDNLYLLSKIVYGNISYKKQHKLKKIWEKNNWLTQTQTKWLYHENNKNKQEQL